MIDVVQKTYEFIQELFDVENGGETYFDWPRATRYRSWKTLDKIRRGGLPHITPMGFPLPVAVESAEPHTR